MDVGEALAMAADAADDPDELLESLEQLCRLRWSDGTPVVAAPHRQG